MGEDMEVVIATEEVDMVEAEEVMEEAVAVMGVEVAAVTIEKPATISIWYCTQLPFYDIYYVSRFNTCKHVTKLLIHFISKTNLKTIQKNLFSMIILPLALAPSSLYKSNVAALQTKYLYLY